MKKILFTIFISLFILTCVYGMNSNLWYYDTMNYMSQKGFLQGMENISPNSYITSQQFTTIVCRIKGINSGNMMESALNNGWYDYDENPPTGEKYNLPIERQLAVKIVMKAFAGNVSYDYNRESAKIKDFSSLDGRYYDAVLGAYSEGIVKGDSSNNFNPHSRLTIAEGCTIIKNAVDKYMENIEVTTEVTSVSSIVSSIKKGVSQNGALQVKGTMLCNEKGEAVVLRGMSSHGLQWFPQFTDISYMKALSQKGANVMRFAMYTDEGGYIQNNSVKNTLISGVDNALSADMYAIIDWHILSDGNPMTHINDAEIFFKEIAEKYKDSKGVIYEICNEPNGNINWSKDVKPYAEKIINIIRSADSDAVILVGCPQWCQDLESVINDRLDYGNIMYTCHFYAGTHGEWLRNRISKALNSGIPVFVSEWGTSDASGSGGVFVNESRVWLEFMKNNNLSWCNWSFCDKNESSAALMSNADPKNGLNLSQSGKIVFDSFN